ncbi:microtubule-associated protein 2-like [Portunus trituberculatus]|uniref:microtubule-associated protein 2-like n=1 Tax=Portunus trituberculatus TaxID=210409 RepID=UPI001E1CBE7C|nr:microtubule-associated protein 2-like [Portunus trituberculatus]
MDSEGAKRAGDTPQSLPAQAADGVGTKPAAPATTTTTTTTTATTTPGKQEQNGVPEHDDNDDVVMRSSPRLPGTTTKEDVSVKTTTQATTEQTRPQDVKNESLAATTRRDDGAKSPVSIVIDETTPRPHDDHEDDHGASGEMKVPEEGHDSGVDETTQAKQENGGSRSPSKGSRGSPKKRMPRSSDPSPIKPRTPTSAPSLERKVPMNKVEVGKSASPNLKAVKSKIGSMDNATYKPGGGKIKIESKKLDYSKASSRIAAKNDAYQPGGGDKKIESQKLKWKVSSKIGSLDNKDHKPGGGDKKIESQKLKFAAQSKIGSKENIKHKPGGGEIKKKSPKSETKIENQKLDFRDKASSKVGSLNNVQHKAGGGDKKIFDDKEYLRQMQGSPCNTSTSKASSEANLSGTQSPSPGLTSPATQDETLEQAAAAVAAAGATSPSSRGTTPAH